MIVCFFAVVLRQGLGLFFREVCDLGRVECLSSFKLSNSHFDLVDLNRCAASWGPYAPADLPAVVRIDWSILYMSRAVVNLNLNRKS